MAKRKSKPEKQKSFFGSYEAEVKAFVKALPERVYEARIDPERPTNDERAESALLAVDLFALVFRTQNEDRAQNIRDLITNLCHLLQRQVESSGTTDYSVDPHTGLVSEEWVLGQADMAIEMFQQELEEDAQDDWARLHYPDLTDGENHVVRIARRQGFALFFPNTSAGGLTFDAAVKHLKQHGWTDAMVVEAKNGVPGAAHS